MFKYCYAGKNKFKFLGHKRNSSTDSKISLGPFSLLNRSKQSTPEQSNLCINGSHVYAEEQETKPNSGSTLSLSGSAKGSIEDLRKYHERNSSAGSVDSFKGLSIPSYKPDSTEREFQVQQRPQEDEDKNKKAEGRLRELFDDQERKKQREHDERRRNLEEDERKVQQERERKRQEEEEQQRKRREEEARKAEEQKRQEESRVTDRLTSLFGLGRKKEEQISPAVESPKHLEVGAPANRFEEIPLGPDSQKPFTEARSAEAQQEVRTAFTPTPPSSGFPARTPKVSAVKPRWAFLFPFISINSHLTFPYVLHNTLQVCREKKSPYTVHRDYLDIFLIRRLDSVKPISVQAEFMYSQ